MGLIANHIPKDKLKHVANSLWKHVVNSLNAIWPTTNPQGQSDRGRWNNQGYKSNTNYTKQGVEASRWESETEEA